MCIVCMISCTPCIWVQAYDARRCVRYDYTLGNLYCLYLVSVCCVAYNNRPVTK